MRSSDSGTVRIERKDTNTEPFENFGLILSYQTATALNSTSLAAHSNNSIALYLSAKRRQRLTGSGRKLVRIIPVCCTQKQPEEKGSREDEVTLVHGLTSSTMVPM